jgi:hypothetical protein
MDFFEGITGSNSNFAKQSFNSIIDASSLKDFKVFLNPTIKNNLTTVGENSDKMKVINSWKDYGLLNEDQIINKIKDFDITGYDFNLNSVEDYLKDTDLWFISIFKEDLL